MSEYKENTVGYWLSQLKEPLKSRALDVANGFLHENCPSLKEAIRYIQEGGAYRITEEDYWRGVFGGVSQYAISPDFCSEMYLEGYYAAIGWSPKSKDGGEDKAIVSPVIDQDSYTINFPAREIEAPERAVVGYQEPLPIDTIEKKHELRIKNLEARVMQLEGVVGKLEQQIEYVYRNLPKDFDGTR